MFIDLDFKKCRPGVDFINVQRAVFTQADPEIAKKTVKLSVFFALLGSAQAKAARTEFMLMKLTPGIETQTVGAGCEPLTDEVKQLTYILARKSRPAYKSN